MSAAAAKAKAAGEKYVLYSLYVTNILTCKSGAVVLRHLPWGIQRMILMKQTSVDVRRVTH